jgi:hypothetical protein
VTKEAIEFHETAHTLPMHLSKMREQFGNPDMYKLCVPKKMHDRLHNARHYCQLWMLITGMIRDLVLKNNLSLHLRAWYVYKYQDANDEEEEDATGKLAAKRRKLEVEKPTGLFTYELRSPFGSRTFGINTTRLLIHDKGGRNSMTYVAVTSVDDNTDNAAARCGMCELNEQPANTVIVVAVGYTPVFNDTDIKHARDKYRETQDSCVITLCNVSHENVIDQARQTRCMRLFRYGDRI